MASPDPNKVAVVKSIAMNGSQGPSMLKAEQAQLAQQQAGAVDAAAQRAGLIGAPQEFLKQSAAKISEPFGTASTKAGSDASALANYMGALQSGHGNYLSQLGAASPLIQQQVDKAQGEANINNLFKLLNLKSDIEGQEYKKYERQTALDEQAKEKNYQAVQQQALNTIVSHPNKGVGAAATNIISTATSLPEALGYLNSDQGKKDLKKLGADDYEVRRLVAQYFDPETAQSFPAPQTNQSSQSSQSSSTASLTPSKKKGPSNYQKLLGTLSNGFKNNGNRPL